MIRIIAVVIFAGLAAGLFLSPGVSPARLATKQVANLLEATVPVLDGAGDPVLDEKGKAKTRALWEEILNSGAVQTKTEDGKEVRYLRMGGVGFNAHPELFQKGEKADPLWPGETGKGLVRRLRAIVAEKDLDIRIDPFKKPDKDGINAKATLRKGNLELRVHFGDVVLASRADEEWRPISQKSLLPPLVAIFLAILLRRPVIALFSGVWAGALLVRLGGGEALLGSIGGSFKDVFTPYFTDQLRDQARIEIVLFVVFMLAMVGIITRAGGIRGIMDRIASIAKDARKTQIATWFMGLAIFFDDYANTILVGSTMRPLADKYRIAREKLAYIVDSTAAPVAGVSILSTWIAFEVSTFSAQLPDAGLAPNDGYAIFIQTLPYRFYCWFTLIFVGLLVFSGRDFGPMLTAERRARGGKLLRDGATPLVGKAATELEARVGIVPKATTAVVPLAVFILTTLGTIIFMGAMGVGLLKGVAGFPGVAIGTAPGDLLQTATGILYEGSGGLPLMYGSIAGFVVAAAMALLRGLSISEVLMAALNSLRAMGVALLILYLAWMVGQVCKDLGTASYLSAILYSSTPYVLLPVALFMLAGLIAFSTGSSWSTMTILLPLVVGLAYDIGYGSSPDPTDAAARQFGLFVMIVSIGAVLEGAIFGDHCSPISDTTVMSSIACASDHVDHVRTQAPYALFTMAVALLIGYFPVVFLGASPWLCLVAGTGVLVLVLWTRGKKVGDAPPQAADGDAPNFDELGPSAT